MTWTVYFRANPTLPFWRLATFPTEALAQAYVASATDPGYYTITPLVDMVATNA